MSKNIVKNVSAGPKSIAIGFNLLSLIPSLVSLAEVFHGGGTGADKKAAVVDLAKSLTSAAGNAVAANNPKYAQAVGAVVDASVATMNASGALPQPSTT
jgi:hypothetical protein